ncbi:hypothetical protein [Haloferula sp.]|uniref:hypothetical protein n=1 Tax=Haloferula sp. TaxID=2497595 RepID=UPI003C7145DC
MPLAAWTPVSTGPAASSGFSVDTSSRNDVVSFWHGAYMPSERYWERINWTGNYGSSATGAEGQISSEFVTDVERRINFVRALCGVPANISMNTGATVVIEAGDLYSPAASTTKAAAVQRSALMAALGTTSSAISHDPASSLAGWTPAAWNGHNKSAISKGFYGPGAVDAYFREDVLGISNWNYEAGHRRWLLAVPVTDMATGDTPGEFNSSTLKIVQPSNLIYVKPKSEELSSAAPRFVSYPGSGFFPVELNTPFWSLSHGGADFSAATVTMTDGSGTPVPTQIVSTRTGFAENAIVWRVPEEVRALSAPSDRTYHITVSSIGGGVSSSYSWSVTLMDPNRLTDPLDLDGPSRPLATVNTPYSLPSVPGSDSMETGFFLREPATWIEAAEDGTDSMVIDRTSPSFELRARVLQSAPGYPDNYFTEGSKAFRLTFATAYDPRLNSISDESFEIDREIIAGSDASVEFQFRRGYMSPTTALACERSMDGGLTWATLGSPITGVGNGQADSAFSLRSIPIPSSEEPFRIRFRLYRTNTAAGFYDDERYPKYATGAFIDEFRLEGCDWLRPAGVVESSATESFVDFGSSTTSIPIVTGQEWHLRSRPVMAGRRFPWGPAKIVEPVGPLGLSGTLEPSVAGETYQFVPDPSAEYHLFEVARFSPNDWTEGAESGTLSDIGDGTSSAYDLISNRAGYQSGGNSSFRLGVQPSDGEDYFVIEREVLATSNSQLDFWIRRGWSSNQQLDVEVSTDGGEAWSSVHSQPGRNIGDNSGTTVSVDLSGFAGRSLRCRFVLRASGAVSFNTTRSGMWIDDISMTGVNEVASATSSPVNLGADAVIFNAATAGGSPVEGASYRLRMFPVSSGVMGEPGPSLFVTPLAAVPTGYELWAAEQSPPLIGGFEDLEETGRIPNGVRYAFGLTASNQDAAIDTMQLSSDLLILERRLEVLSEGVIYEAEISSDLRNWSSDGVVVTHADGYLRASAARPGGAAFLRWKVSEE